MTNDEIQTRALRVFNAKPPSRPRIGDFVRLTDGTLRRFTYDFGNRIQTTCHGGYGPESFYLDDGGLPSYSGALDRCLPLVRIELSDETCEGEFWHFDCGISGAGRGVQYRIPCRVYVETPA